MFGKKIDSSKIPPVLLDRMIKKGLGNVFNTYRVVCAAYNKRGELLGITTNSFRRDPIPLAKYSNCHCEMKALHRWGGSIKSMVIMRIGHGGDIRPIECCPKCEAVLKKCGIKVFTIGN